MILTIKGVHFYTMIKRVQDLKHTIEVSLMGNTGFDVDLHNGCELNLKIKAIGGVDYNEER